MAVLAAATVPDAAAYSTLELIPDNGTLYLNGQYGGSSAMFNGTLIEGGGSLSNGVRTYLVHGDLNLGEGDEVTAPTGTAYAVRLLVGNDANLGFSALIEFSASGRNGDPLRPRW